MFRIESGVMRPIAIAGWLASNPTKVKSAFAAAFRHRSKSTIDLRRPWWPDEAIEYVASRVEAGWAAFEFGGGGSTLWLHDLGVRCISIEHDEGWYRLLAAELPSNADLRLVPPSSRGVIESHGVYFDEYVNSIRPVEDGSLDLVLLDGRARVACGLAAAPKVRRGGMMVLDDSHRSRYRALADRLSEWRVEHIYGLRWMPTSVSRVTVWTRP